MKNFRNFILFILARISRVIFWITPIEFKRSQIDQLTLKKRYKNAYKLEEKLYENLLNETLINFEEKIKKSVIYKDSWSIREYAIKSSYLNDKKK